MSVKDITQARHPLYTFNAPIWQFYADCVEGGPLFPQKYNPLARPVIGAIVETAASAGLNRYLVKHPLEDSSEYIARLYKCPNVNLCGPAIDLLVGTVGAPDNVVLEVGPDFQQMLDDVDLTGLSYLQFMADARAHAATYGHVFILVDSTKANGPLVTEADAIIQGIRPYARQILPKDMLSWRLDSNGAPTEILFRVKTEVPGSILEATDAKEEVYEYRYWDRSQWVVYKEVGEDVVQVDQGVNPIGVIPVAVLYHKRIKPFLGESLVKESARYGLLLTNWLSDLDATMTMQSFSQACLRSKDAPTQVGIGSAKVLHLSPETREGDQTYGAEDFFYRSPDSGPLSTMWDSFFRLVDLANESMSLQPEATTDKSHPESGISRAWRWHATTKRLVMMATNEQETARSLFYYAARWKGMDAFNGQIVYGTHFDLSALEQDIQNMLAIQTMGIPASAQNEMKSRIVKKALPNLDPVKADQIDQDMAKMDTVNKLLDRRITTDTMDDAG